MFTTFIRNNCTKCNFTDKYENHETKYEAYQEFLKFSMGLTEMLLSFTAAYLRKSNLRRQTEMGMVPSQCQIIVSFVV